MDNWDTWAKQTKQHFKKWRDKTMDDYIKRSDAIKSRGTSCTRDCSDCDFARDGDSWCEGEVFVTSLLQIPAADVRPVVLCRECVHWERYDNTAGCGYCHKVKFEYGADGYVFNPVRDPDFYCADGRKADVLQRRVRP